MKRTLVIITFTLLLVAMMPSLARAAVTAGSSSGTQVATPAAITLSYNERLLVKLINKERTKRGLHAVSVQINLMRSARAHSADMACHKFFSHNSANGELFYRRIIRYGYSRTGYSSWRAGEDLYYGSGLLSSPVAVVRAWMKSPAHRAVILNRALRDIGVGARVCATGYRGISRVTFFTLDMGRRIR